MPEPEGNDTHMLIPLDPGLTVQRQRARLTAAADGSFLLTDGTSAGHQFLEVRHPDFARALLRLRLELRPLNDGEGDFLLLRADRGLIARVGRDGTLRLPPDAPGLEASCTPDASGWWHLDISFRNFSPAFLLALGRPGTRYAGTGQPQFALRHAGIEIVERRWLPTPEDGLVVLEVGTAGRQDPAWLPHLESLRTIICEPNEAVGRAALAALPPRDDHILLPHALSNRSGAGKINTTHDTALSSVLDPDQRRVKGFASARGFEVTDSAKVQLTRFDSLSRQLNLPQPHVLRIRAGGAEFDALRGCGDVLDGVLGIEAQVHVYPLYRRQKLLGDVMDLLDGYGFALRRLQPHAMAGTAHELVAATAYLTRRKVEGPALGKVALIEEVWGVSWPR